MHAYTYTPRWQYLGDMGHLDQYHTGSTRTGDMGRIMYRAMAKGLTLLPDPEYGRNCRVFEAAPAPKQRQRVFFDHGPQGLHDAHVGAWCLEQIDNHCDSHDGTSVRPEHWRLVRSADTGNDVGQYERDTRGEAPKGFKSCLHNLPSRVSPTRLLSKDQRAKIAHERATFGIREVIEAQVQTKRRGRPSKATMQARAKAGI